MARYMAEVARHPILSAEEEAQLAHRYAETKDVRLAHRLVNANLRFVVRIAREFRGYGVPFLDLVQEGNLGLMAGVRRFDPSRGYRVVSYAVWWIRAYMRACTMHNWSMVKVGTTQAQRRLFFSVRAARAAVQKGEDSDRGVSDADLAHRLGVRETDLCSMENRLKARDTSLDQRLGDDGHLSHLDQMPAPTPNAEEIVAAREVNNLARLKLAEVAPGASAKETYVLKHRLTAAEPLTLQQIGDHLQISRERVRQLETKLLDRVRTRLRECGVDAAA
ncbi:MAG: RNA polymerase factor sigma-32 [Deltaproteobacteria bacterium]|nr:RNA polymerase factor sigma-32 [Deltaproteobacteria bacterium]